jgi:SAM-dependent methyltransferase
VTSFDYDATMYGTLVAADYDSIYEDVFDTAGAVRLACELAGTNGVLEFGVGTGRLAIPLAETGLEVHGVDASAEMLSILQRKPGSGSVATTLGDISEVRIDRNFSLVLLSFNTIFALPDQAAQVRCFANAARHLAPGGRFIVEAWVPDVSSSSEPTIKPRRLAKGLAGLVIGESDRVHQLLFTTQIVLGGARKALVYPVVHRYTYPSELDLMAQLAGLTLEDRFADWHRNPFTSTSTEHVTIYQKP